MGWPARFRWSGRWRPTLASRSGSGDVAGGLGTATGLLAPFGAHAVLPKGLEAIPSTERAGRNFETVMSKAGNQPLDLTPVQQYLTRAQQLNKTGAGGIPPPLKQFGKMLSDPNAPPMDYRTGRDFASNAGSLSAHQNMRTNAPMKAQLSQFAQAMDEANRGAAEQAGVGKEYGSAMTEYRRAMQIPVCLPRTQPSVSREPRLAGRSGTAWVALSVGRLAPES